MGSRRAFESFLYPRTKHKLMRPPAFLRPATLRQSAVASHCESLLVARTALAFSVYIYTSIYLLHALYIGCLFSFIHSIIHSFIADPLTLNPLHRAGSKSSRPWVLHTSHGTLRHSQHPNRRTPSSLLPRPFPPMPPNHPQPNSRKHLNSRFLSHIRA